MVIDDIFFIWSHGEDKLKKFLEDLNQFYPNIIFTHESSKESTPYLGLIVKLSQEKLEIDLHIKPTDKHQYLYYSSSHPGHARIVFALIKQILGNTEQTWNHGFLNAVILMMWWRRKWREVKFSKISSTRCTISGNLSSWFENYWPKYKHEFKPSLYRSRS